MNDQNLANEPSLNDQASAMQIGPQTTEPPIDGKQQQEQKSYVIPETQPSQRNSAPPMPILSSTPNTYYPITTPIQQNLSSGAPMTPQQLQQSEQQQQQQQQQKQQVQMQPQLLMQPHPPPIKPLLADESTSETAPVPNTVPNQAPSQKQESLSPQKAVVTKVKLSDELNIFDWFSTREIISQLAEKAKSSVDSVITTLDPGMKEYLYSGGNVNIVVITDSECLVSPIRDAFQSVFGRATVTGARYNMPDTTIAYPIKTACGFREAAIVAHEKVKKLRQDTSSVPQNQVVVVVQPALVNPGATNDMPKDGDRANEVSESEWFAAYCLFIEDPVLGVSLKCYGQLIPVDSDVIQSAREAKYPDDLQSKHLGFPATLDELMSYKLRLNPMDGFGDEYGCKWLRTWAGIYESQIVHQLGLTLANSYRRKWNDCARLDTVS